MAKKKIADSIIIRVGGGIREVQRKPADVTEISETSPADIEKEENKKSLQPLSTGPTTISKINHRKMVN